MSTDTHVSITKEREGLDKWRVDGKPEHSALWTPYLDRLDALCKEAGINRAIYLDLLKTYSDRCELAHRAPPRVENFRIGDGSSGEGAWRTIDWKKMEECAKRRADMQTRFENGQLDEGQRNFYDQTISLYWSRYCEGWGPDSTPILTTMARKASNANKGQDTKKKKTDVPPDPDYPSVYKRGKWDDIPLKGISTRAWAGEPVHSFGELSSCIYVWFFVFVWMMTKNARFGTGSQQASLSLEYLDTRPACIYGSG
jgi:hypothetical protein